MDLDLQELTITKIANLHGHGETYAVQGFIQWVALNPKPEISFEICILDSSGEFLNAIWQGQRNKIGIQVGKEILLAGTVLVLSKNGSKEKIMYSPEYVIL